MLLNLDISTLDSHATIVAAGEIDLSTVPLLSTTLADAIAAGSTEVVVNLNKIGYIDSAGLGALVGAHKRLRAKGGSLVIRCAQPQVVRLFTITGLTNVLEIDQSSDESRDDAPAAAERSAAPVDLVDSANG